MDDSQLLRYSRQIMLPYVGIEGQQKLRQSKALIIGMGGLGSPVAMYLAAAGVGTLYLNDFDTVELSNLQRQIIHDSDHIGQTKINSACHTLEKLNPEVQLHPLPNRLDSTQLHQIVGEVDIVIDGSDNFTTRFAVNTACVRNQRPLISGAVIRMEGQVAVFQPALSNSPCYHCLYREGAETNQSCSETGILAPVAGIIGSIQATETIKVLLSIGESLTGKLLVLDALSMEIRVLQLPQDPACPICSDARLRA